MAGSCIEKISHECGSSDGLQIFKDEGEYTGYCFACSTYVPDPYKDKPDDYKPTKVEKSPEQIEAELAEIETYKVVDLPTRSLRASALDYFGVKVGVSEEDGSTPSIVFFPYFKGNVRSGYKVKLLEPKKIWSMGEMKDVDLFGWQQALATGAKRLYITEGEPDAVALFQAFKDTAKPGWEHYNPAVVSLPSGAGSAYKALSGAAQDIKANFKEVILVFDQDPAGKKAVTQAMQVLPFAETVTLPGKDPNACIIEGRTKALVNACLFKSNTPKNSRIVNASKLFQAAKVAPKYGLSWPWEGMTKLTRGLRFGETYYLGGPVKMGKSEIVNTLGAHLMIEHNLPVFMAKPEEANVKTVKMVAGKVAGKFFHDPDREWDEEAYISATNKIGDRLHLLDLYQHLGWDTLRSDIINAVEAGARAVFIDPITNLTNGISSGEANTKLQGIAQDLAALSKDLDIMSFIFCHLKAPESGDPHERGGKVLSHQFSGSRAMMRSCNYMLGLEGNKDPNIPEDERNTRRLVLLEDREFGESGIIRLYWDRNTSLFSEIK